MERREFLVRAGSMLMLVPATWSVACGGDSKDGDLRFTSSAVENHTHDVTITMAEVTSPAGDVSRDTTSSSGHMHTVVLSTADLAQIGNGQTVTKETTVTEGHSHTFTFVRSAAKSTSSSGGGY